MVHPRLRRYFTKYKGRYSLGAVLLIAASLVTMIPPAIIARVIALGVGTGLLSILPAFLIKTQPEDIGMLPDGDKEIEPYSPSSPTQRVNRSGDYSFMAKEAWRTPTLWLLIAVVVFGSFSPTAFPTNLVGLYVDRGFSTSTAAMAFSGYGLASFMGRFLWGGLADRLHIRQTLLVIASYSGFAVAMILLLPGDLALAGGAIAGLGLGGWVGLNQVVWADYFG